MKELVKKLSKVFLVLCMSMVLMMGSAYAGPQCDKSADPLCFELLDLQECVNFPLKGYALDYVEVTPQPRNQTNSITPKIMEYTMELCDTKVEAQVELYDQLRMRTEPLRCQKLGEICYTGSTVGGQLGVAWKNLAQR